MNKLVMTVVASSLLALLSNNALATEQTVQPVVTAAPSNPAPTSSDNSGTNSHDAATTSTQQTAPASDSNTANNDDSATPAQQTTPASNDANTTSTPQTTPTSNTDNTPAQQQTTPASNGNSTAPAEQTAPATNTPQSSLPWNKDTAATGTINCQYVLPSDQKNFTDPQLQAWAKFASIASFTYDYQNYQNEFDKLKQCFTDNGWKSFNQALTKSGNLDVVKKEKLSVSATAGQPITIDKVAAQDNQNIWKVTLPLAVNYKGDQVSAEQNLQVTLRIKQKQNADGKAIIGIEQLIASPQQSSSESSATTTNSNNNAEKNKQ